MSNSFPFSLFWESIKGISQFFLSYLDINAKDDTCYFKYFKVKTIFKFLSKSFDETKGALDLSFEDASVAEEKIPFLAQLAGSLETTSYIPYELPIGSTIFRNLITGFLRSYHNIPISQNVSLFT